MDSVSGENLYGRVDSIRGVGYLATEFTHFNFIPLSPVQTYLVLHRPGVGGFFKARTEWAGLTIPAMMGRSILATWIRTAAFFYVVWRLLVLGYDKINFDPPSYGRFAIALAIFVVAWCTRYIPASFNRAVQLLKLADAPDEVARAVEKAYGRLIPEDWPGRKAATSLAASPAAIAPAPIETGELEGEEINLNAATGADVVVAQQPESQGAEWQGGGDEFSYKPSLLSQALHATTRPNVSTARELLRLGLLGIGVGLTIAMAGGLLARLIVVKTGFSSSLFGLPAIYGLLVAGVGFYRALFAQWPSLARSGVGARLARIGIGVVALSIVGAIFIGGIIFLNEP